MQRDSQDETIKAQAIELVSSGDFSGAAPLLRAYHERYPDDLEALIWLTVCVPPAEALPLTRRLIELQPDSIYARAWSAYYSAQVSPAPAPVVAAPSPVEVVATSAYPYPVETEAPLKPAEPVLVKELEAPETLEEPSLYPYAASTNGAASVPVEETIPVVAPAVAESAVVENPVVVVDENAATVEGKPVANGATAADLEGTVEAGPVSLLELLPDFQPLPDTAVVIPPPPPPARLELDPLPLLDPNEWLTRASQDARRIPEISDEESSRLYKFIEFVNKSAWLDPAPRNPDGSYQEQTEHRTLYNRGIELARGGAGNWNRLTEAIQLFRQCPPPLAFAGASEALVSASRIQEQIYNPIGLVYAVFWADRALTLDPFHLDALIARSEATVRSPWRLLADITVDRLRLLAPTHPRRYAIDGWYEFLQGNRPRATELLRQAVATALTPAEKRLCTQALELAQPPAPSS